MKGRITKVIGEAEMRGREPVWLRCALRAAFAGTKGDMAVTEEAEEDRKHEDDGARDIGRAVIASGLAADDHHHKWKRGSGHYHAAGIDAQASGPFLEVIALGLEYKPLISEKGEGDTEEVRQHTRQNVSVSYQRTQQHSKQCIAAITKNRVARADDEVADQLWAARHGQTTGRHGQTNRVNDQWWGGTEFRLRVDIRQS